MRMIIWLLLIYIGYRVVVSLISAKKTAPNKNEKKTEAATTHRDPICGMYVSEDDAIVGRVNDQRHYFCSMTCLEKYREQLDHPQRS